MCLHRSFGQIDVFNVVINLRLKSKKTEFKMVMSVNSFFNHILSYYLGID